jgi:hypothetical protein
MYGLKPVPFRAKNVPQGLKALIASILYGPTKVVP